MHIYRNADLQNLTGTQAVLGGSANILLPLACINNSVGTIKNVLRWHHCRCAHLGDVMLLKQSFLFTQKTIYRRHTVDIYVHLMPKQH